MLMERQVVSAEAFLELVELPEYAHRRLELVEGEIVEMAGPGGDAWRNLLVAHVMPMLAGYVSCANAVLDASYWVAMSTFVLGIRIQMAEILFARNRYGIPCGRDKVPGPTSLKSRCVSTATRSCYSRVISPSNTAADIAKKIQQLFDAGTELIWIVYPELRAVAVHTLDGAITLDENDTLTGGDILPGFAIQVSEIFPS